MADDRSSPTDRRTVAVYWDLEGLSVAEYDRVYGAGRWYSDRIAAMDSKALGRHGQFQAARLNIAVVIKHLADLGQIAINRFYADWAATAFAHYSGRGQATKHPPAEFCQLHTNVVLPIEIRLPADVLHDLARNPAVTDVVVCSGHRTFDALADHCRRSGRLLHAIGLTTEANGPWRAATEFKNYSDIVPALPSAEPQPWIPAVLEPFGQEPGTRIAASRLKQLIRERDSAFNEKTYGFNNRFRGLLRDVADRGFITLDAGDGAGDLWVSLGPQRFSG
ncbi:hypothetical protein [Mycolicibacterium llatzerense]|uniref:hypothetical protein n=1 Tax=Mycolicibacterium llatzerense TaxID=280871 RepID=UPI0008DE1A60|nr:hypothetical protein [Mycolicibacterium llatzerense]